MDNFNSYEFDNILDTSNITSDVRFAHVMDGDINSLVIQFTNIHFFADPFEDSFDISMNFQIWLKANGMLEVHFGEMNMDGTPIYEPGRGFYCYTTSGGLDTNEVCGPHMGISHPLNPDIAISLNGAYNDYEIAGDAYGVLTVLPPEGWVIRFIPTFVSTSNAGVLSDDLFISPNPATSQIRIPVTDSRVIILDGTGRIVFHGVSGNGILDVNSFPAGMYYLHVISGSGISSGKFVKT
jgi:hypothetical protein